jgi:hypothetical protein
VVSGRSINVLGGCLPLLGVQVVNEHFLHNGDAVVAVFRYRSDVYRLMEALGLRGGARLGAPGPQVGVGGVLLEELMVAVEVSMLAMAACGGVG